MARQAAKEGVGRYRAWRASDLSIPIDIQRERQSRVFAAFYCGPCGLLPKRRQARRENLLSGTLMGSINAAPFTRLKPFFRHGNGVFCAR